MHRSLFLALAPVAAVITLNNNLVMPDAADAAEDRSGTDHRGDREFPLAARVNGDAKESAHHRGSEERRFHVRLA